MKRTLYLPLALILLAVLVIPASARGKADGKNPAAEGGAAKNEKVTVSGRVRLVGSVPFTDLVIRDAEGNDWYIDEADRKTLAGREQRAVTVKAIVEVKEMTLANGKKMEDRRILRDIRIVE